MSGVIFVVNKQVVNRILSVFERDNLRSKAIQSNAFIFLFAKEKRFAMFQNDNIIVFYFFIRKLDIELVIRDIDADDIKLLSTADAVSVLKQNYWNRWKADQIANQSVAEILVDWVWGSGKWGIVIPQRLLKVTDDGIGIATEQQVDLFERSFMVRGASHHHSSNTLEFNSGGLGLGLALQTSPLVRL